MSDSEMRESIHEFRRQYDNSRFQTEPGDKRLNGKEFEDALMSLFTEKMVKAREDELNEVLKHAYYPHDSGYEFILALNVRNRLASLKEQLTDTNVGNPSEQKEKK